MLIAILVVNVLSLIAITLFLIAAFMRLPNEDSEQIKVENLTDADLLDEALRRGYSVKTVQRDATDSDRIRAMAKLGLN